MTHEGPDEIEVKISTTCRGLTIDGTCTNVHVGEVLDFVASIELRDCPKKKNHIIKIFPEGLSQYIIIDLELQCDCSCSSKKSITYEVTSSKCNGQGDLKCGICSCFDGKFGRSCQCDSSNSQSENVTQCIMEGTTDICSGIKKKFY